ncbi:unnamed protein product [Auanema sp. JU1783]|nr:unnamed protein product [Auanema sp. JU1783]
MAAHKGYLNKFTTKYDPEVLIEGTRTIHKYPTHRMEVTLSFGVTEEVIRFLESVVETYYKGPETRDSLAEITKIAETVEGTLGGYWSILFLDDPYGYAFTIYRRSPSYVVLDVNGQGISIAKEPV